MAIHEMSGFHGGLDVDCVLICDGVFMWLITIRRNIQIPTLKKWTWPKGQKRVQS
jgi:hypothetical protein